jgi:hypothetical protein
MGTAPTPVLVSSAGTGNSADGVISRDAIDDLIGGMSSKLLIYLRAKKMSTIKASFVDALGNAVTCNQTSECTYAASDSNFNSHPSITFNNPSGTGMYQMAAGGIGIGTPPVAMTDSFTIMTCVHLPSSPDSVNSLYGDNAGTSGPSAETGASLTSTGALSFNIGGTGGGSGLTGVLLAPGATGVVWVSFDSATSIVRAGIDNTTVAMLATMTYNRTGAGTGTVCYPFGYFTIGNAGNSSWNRWTLWNKAFMNGSVPADDAAFTNLVAQYAAYL